MVFDSGRLGYDWAHFINGCLEGAAGKTGRELWNGTYARARSIYQPALLFTGSEQGTAGPRVSPKKDTEHAR